ncbi:hypothetical protein [Streptomyces sp. NPDC058629]|uniref:hypothetical protein n=1 Tax=Streptomyces sp. NPDC058629 TaxID=3346565 RepID=UPI0036662FD1
MFTGEDEQDRAGAAAVAWVPPAAMGVALAGPQMLRQGIVPGVAGEVRQGLGGGTSRGRAAGRALRAVEYGPAPVGA